MRAIYFILIILGLGSFSCSVLDEEAAADIIITNTPVVVNNPGAFSYIEKMERKNEVFENELFLANDSTNLNIIISSLKEGEIGIKLLDQSGELKFDKRFKSNHVMTQTLDYNPSRIIMTMSNSSSVLEISITD